MARRWILPILFLPGTALVLVPGALLIVFRQSDFSHTLAGPGELRFWLGLLALFLGLALAGWTMSLFFQFGQGTPAPWDPPLRFLVRGPYRYVRNPMMLGAFSILVAEVLITASLPILAWLLVFLIGNAVYIPSVEEPGLKARFGTEYTVFMENVPRWIPRTTPWETDETLPDPRL